MQLAPPIVSQACIFLTKLLSDNIFLTEKAKDSVTANGKPSGIAITTIETPIMKKSKSLVNCDAFTALS